MKKINFSSAVVIFSIIHIDLFIGILIYMAFNNYTLSDTAITCVFTFFGVELINIARIKIGKIKYNQSYEENVESEDNENEYQ